MGGVVSRMCNGVSTKKACLTSFDVLIWLPIVSFSESQDIVWGNVSILIGNMFGGAIIHTHTHMHIYYLAILIAKMY